MNTKFKKELFPKKEEIFSWIEYLSQWGHRKTGTPEGRKSAEYIEAKMKEFGLSDVKIEKTPSMCMDVDEYSLQIDGDNVECFFANGTNRDAEEGTLKMDNEESEFIYLGAGNEDDMEGKDIKGKIVICDIYFNPMDISKLIDIFDGADVYDPEGKLKKPVKKYNIWSPNNWPFNYFRALEGGAKGFVGILADYYDDPYWYSEDYTSFGKPYGIEYMSLPALWISRSSGNALKEKFASKDVLKGEMKMQSTYGYKDALNVSGKLEGMSPEIVLVHSHHDAVFSGSVQDASGISEMLALAKYFSQLSVEERPKTMMFAATDTHYTDYLGHQAFIKKRIESGEKIILDIAMEHVGKETYFDDDYNEHETGEVEPRLVYITKESGLKDVVKAKFMQYGLDKTLFTPVDLHHNIDSEYEFSEDEVISDAYYFNEWGIPIVSMVAAEMYIYHVSDKPDRIPIDALEPMGMAFAEIAMEASNKL